LVEIEAENGWITIEWILVIEECLVLKVLHHLHVRPITDRLITHVIDAAVSFFFNILDIFHWRSHQNTQKNHTQFNCHRKYPVNNKNLYLKKRKKERKKTRGKIKTVKIKF
jgi:hypothetical protein